MCIRDRVSSGFDLLRDRKSLAIQTGIPDLDQLVRGGFQTGFTYEVFGLPGVGKTQLALTLASQCLQSSMRQSNVVYLDTKNDFRIERLVEILRERQSNSSGDGDSSSSSSKSETLKKSLLQKLRVKKDFYLSDILKSLSSIVNSIEACSKQQQQSSRKRRRSSDPPSEPHAQDPFWSRIRLVILDNIGSLVLPELGEDSKNLNEVCGIVAQIKILLKHLVTRFNICALVINTATSRTMEGACGRQVYYKPSLGKIFEDAADVKIYVEKNEKQNELSNLSRTVRILSLIHI